MKIVNTLRYNHKFLNKTYALFLIMGISENNEIRSNLLQCPRDNNDKIFFTLMDYLNNLFMSNDPKDILRFYDYFDNRDQLIKWMIERPKGNYRIVEFNKDENDIIVVIPTMNVNRKFAKTCMDDIFKGLHIIFVESDVGNYYFNYAHNSNAGIKKAMEYNPKWIILSNDDMYKIDNVDVLEKELGKLDNKKVDIVFLKNGDYYSDPLYLGKKTWKYKLYKYIVDRDFLKLFKKFKMDYFYVLYNFKWRLLTSLVFKKVPNSDFINIAAFGIFSSNYLKKFENIFDNTYINESEDMDISFRSKLENANTVFIKYRIGAIGGGTMSWDRARELRAVASRAYFNYKYSNLLDNLFKNIL
jgi:hypothetical protein